DRQKSNGPGSRLKGGNQREQVQVSVPGRRTDRWSTNDDVDDLVRHTHAAVARQQVLRRLVGQEQPVRSGIRPMRSRKEVPGAPRYVLHEHCAKAREVPAVWSMIVSNDVSR